MIRPTMSHAVNKDELFKLMSDYATYLEGRKTRYSNRAAIAETRLREEEQENAKLRADIKILEHDISELYLENGLLETELGIFKEEMGGLKNENAKLREEVKNLKQGMIIMEENCDSVQKRADGFSKNIAEMSGLIRKEQDRAEKAETEASQLEIDNGLLEEEVANYHEKLREAIQAERKRWAKEDAEALRVRDIEQQIKALESSLTENSRTIPFPYNCNTDVVYSDDIKYDIEQLRKELEK